MKSIHVWGVVSLAVLLTGPGLAAQQPVPSADGAEPAAAVRPAAELAAPVRLIKFSGALKDALGQPFGSAQDKPRLGTVGVTFALYADPEGGAPLWLETQNVALDPEGRYTVLLGATRREGLPLKLFAASEARWLGIQVEGEPEQPRILLVSVPYALKAEEAERLAGRKADEFVLAEELKSPEGREKLGLTDPGNFPAATIRATKFRATAATGPAFIWTGTTGPVLQTPTTALVANLNADLLDSLDSADLQRRVSATCPVGQSIRAIASDGTVTCELDDIGVSSGGTVTQIDTGTGLTGGPITTAGTVSLNTTFTDGRYLQLLGGSLLGDLAGTRADFSGDVRSNTFHLIPFGTADATAGFSSGFLEAFASAFDSDLPGPITPGFRWQVTPVNNNTPSPAGRLELGYSADGSTLGPTGLLINSDGTITFAPGQTFSGTFSGTATDLNCAACVSVGELDFDPATQAELDAHKASDDHAATYVNVAGDTMTGALSLTAAGAGLSVTNAATVGGNLTLGGSINGGLRIQADPTSPNVIGGSPANFFSGGVFGAAVGGGGDPSFPNRVTDNYGTVGGGFNNQAGDNAGTTSDRQFATVGGGTSNTASGGWATVGGGDANTASGSRATVGGGLFNTASGTRATVAGGDANTASGSFSTVGGGFGNTASNSSATVGGGASNTASGLLSTVPGGLSNLAQGAFSFAAGRRAKANHDGAFVWADSTDADFASGAVNEFRVRATGGAFFSNTVTAAAFVGDGAGLTNVTAGTASDLNCAGCVSVGELDFDPATQSELDTEALARAAGDTTVQADLAAHKVSDDHAAAYVNVAGDTMGGALSLTAAGTGLSVSNDASLGGNLNLPNTASAGVGVLTLGGVRFLHNFGTGNNFVGTEAGNFTMTGTGNNGVGTSALFSNTTGSDNSAFGVEALFSNTTGFLNSAFGRAALISNTAGNLNSAFGPSALAQLTSGDGNTAIGAGAGGALTSGSGNLYIASPGGASSESDTIRIGSTHTATFLAGTVTAAAFVGDGAGLTNVTAGTANDLNCVGCVSEAELGFGVATQAELNAHKASDDHAATYVNVAGDTMGGALSLTAAGTGLSVTNDATVGGNLTLGGSINGGLRIQADPTSPNLIGGSPLNFFSGGVVGATVGGGGDLAFPNRVTDNFGTVGGGENNQAGDNDGTTSDRRFATVAGGEGNTASGDRATVGGGLSNTASGGSATVAGGQGNTASGVVASVGGGSINTASGGLATVGGGFQNTASGVQATMGGGFGNTASGVEATVGGGQLNTASGSQATVPGGQLNLAQGAFSFAAGRRARALHDGAFVWGDSTNADVASSGANQFIARASGGFTFYTNSTLTTGAILPATGSAWLVLSDRASKENFQPVDGNELLTRLDAIPVLTWNWIAQGAEVRHMGPMAQDFHSAFGVGEDDKHISTVDADGVALAAVQALYRLTLEKDKQIVELSRQVEELRAQVKQLAAAQEEQAARSKK